MSDDEKKTARIENWEIITTPQGHRYVVGKVFGHPNAQDGSMIRTSEIVEVITKNTHYLLGKKLGKKCETQND